MIKTELEGMIEAKIALAGNVRRREDEGSEHSRMLQIHLRIDCRGRERYNNVFRGVCIP